MFEILVYTDSSENESLNGRTGFQFIARSPNASPSDELVARDKLQHTVPMKLDSDSWEGHPATCAYVTEGARMYLSRGASTGITIGGRPGNQLTVTIMSSETFDVLPQRPAQLYASPSWTFERPGSQTLEPLLAPLEIAEDFDVPALHGLVTHDPWAADALPSVLTMLEATQAERRVRLVIKHSDQRTVMRWVALLSRFLDGDAALRLEFRVFAEDPVSASAHIVGAHPLLSPDLRIGRSQQLGINLLDLEAREYTPVPPSESAVRHARWFLDGDPYESLEAIETSRRWSRVMDSALAARAAELATMASSRAAVTPHQLRTALEAVHALAEAGCADELEAYGDELADIVSSCPPSGPEDLLAIDRAMWAAQKVGEAELAQSLALAAIEWAAAQPESARQWAASMPSRSEVATLTWPDTEARTHASSLLAVSIAEAADGDLPAMFTLLGSLGTGIAPATVAAQIDRLAQLWVHDPGLTRQANLWLHREEIIEATTQRLDAALTSGEVSVVRSFQAGDWDWLAPSPWVHDPARRVTMWFAAKELTGAQPARRAEILSAVQGECPNASWPMFLRTPAGLQPHEVVEWIRTHRSIDPMLAAEIEDILADTRAFPLWAQGGAAKVLHVLNTVDSQVVPSGLLSRSLQQQSILALFESAAAERTSVPNTMLASLAKYPDLAGIYGDWIIKAILESADLRQAIGLSRGHERDLQRRLSTILDSFLRAGRSEHLALAARLLNPVYGAWGEAAKSALDAVWDDRSTEETRERMLAQVDEYLGEADRPLLDGFIADQGKHRLTRSVFRGARSLFSGKDEKEASWRK